MKYIFVTDFLNITIKWKLLATFFLIILGFPLFLYFTSGVDFNNKEIINFFFINIGGLNHLSSLFEFIVLVLNIGFWSYLTIYIFTITVDLGNENVYLRMNYKNWIKYKIFSILTIISVLTIFEIIILSIVYNKLGCTLILRNIFLLSIKATLSNLILCFINLVFFQFSKKYFYLLTLCVYVVGALNFDKIFISNILFSAKYNDLFPFLFLIIIIFLFYILSCINIYKVFGKE